jgi:hypothetical protein
MLMCGPTAATAAFASALRDASLERLVSPTCMGAEEADRISYLQPMVYFDEVSPELG